MNDRKFAPDFAVAVERSLDFAQLRRTVAAHVAEIVADPRFRDAERILIGGSGDSHFAALATVDAFRRWTGLPAEAKTAMELARYAAPLLGPRDLVISISNSGSSARAREVVLLARSRGSPTLGVTGSLTGPLAALADRIIHRPVVEETGLPAQYGRCLLHVAEYLAVLYALYVLALELGVARGRLDPATRTGRLAAIEDAIARVPEIAAAIEPQTAVLAAELGELDTIFTIGAGPSRGTAQYCAAKYHEQMPLNGVACDLEEWAHLEYFLTLAWGRRSAVFVIAPPGNSFDRACELVTGIEGAGGRAIVVTQGADLAIPEATARFDLGIAIDEWISPLVYFLPTQLMLLHMAARAGIPLIPLRRRDATWLITGGVVRESTAGLD